MLTFRLLAKQLIRIWSQLCVAVVHRVFRHAGSDGEATDTVVDIEKIREQARAVWIDRVRKEAPHLLTQRSVVEARRYRSIPQFSAAENSAKTEAGQRPSPPVTVARLESWVRQAGEDSSLPKYLESSLEARAFRLNVQERRTFTGGDTVPSSSYSFLPREPIAPIADERGSLLENKEVFFGSGAVGNADLDTWDTLLPPKTPEADRGLSVVGNLGQQVITSSFSPEPSQDLACCFSSRTEEPDLWNSSFADWHFSARSGAPDNIVENFPDSFQTGDFDGDFSGSYYGPQTAERLFDAGQESGFTKFSQGFIAGKTELASVSSLTETLESEPPHFSNNEDRWPRFLKDRQGDVPLQRTFLYEIDRRLQLYAEQQGM